MARRAAQVSVVKKGLPVPAARMIARPFSRCRIARRRMNGSQTAEMDEGRHHARRLAHGFHRLLQRHAVDDGGEHAHVVGGRPLDVLGFGEGRATDEVAAADDDGQLHAQLGDLHALACHALQLGAADAQAAFLAETLAGDLQQYTFVGGSGGLGTGLALRHSWRAL